MKNAFSFPRFLLLLRRDWAMTKKQWLKMSLIMAGITTAILFAILNLTQLDGATDSVRLGMMFRQMAIGTFFGILLIGGSISSSSAFEELHERGRGIAYLMLPATKLEKWASALFFSLLIYGIVALASLTTAVFISSTAFNAMHSVKIPTADIWYFLNPMTFWQGIGAFTLAHSIYFLGSTWFQKNHWMNTTLWVIGIAVLVSTVGNVFFPRLLFGKGVEISQHGSMWFANIENEGTFSLPVAAFWNSAGKFLTFVSVPFLWFLAFLRLSEKEI